MPDNTIYTVRISAGDQEASLEMSLKIYNLLFFKNYSDAPTFTYHDDKRGQGVLVEIQKDTIKYFWKTTQQVADILSKEYSLEIIEQN